MLTLVRAVTLTRDAVTLSRFPPPLLFVGRFPPKECAWREQIRNDPVFRMPPPLSLKFRWFHTGKFKAVTAVT